MAKQKHLIVREGTAEQIKEMAKARRMTIMDFVQLLADQANNDEVENVTDIDGVSKDELQRIKDAGQHKIWTSVSVTNFTATMIDVLSEHMMMPKYIILEGLVRARLHAFNAGETTIDLTSKYCNPLNYSKKE